MKYHAANMTQRDAINVYIYKLIKIQWFSLKQNALENVIYKTVSILFRSQCVHGIPQNNDQWEFCQNLDLFIQVMLLQVICHL